MKSPVPPSCPRPATARWALASLALNGVLLGVLAWKFAPSPAPVSSRVATAVAPAALAVASPAASRDSESRNAPPPSVWVDQLRKLGVPETTLAEIASQYFNARNLAETEALRTRIGAHSSDADSLAALDLRQRLEKKTAMREALGAGAFHRWDRDRTLRESGLDRLALSFAEAESLYTLQSGLEDSRIRLQLAREKGAIDPHDTDAKDAELIKNHEERLQSILGPARMARRLNPPASSPEAALREQLGAYEAPAGKFDDLLAADMEWNARFAEQRANLGDEGIDALLHDRDLAYRRALGPEEYERFKRANDPAVGAMVKYAQAWKLSSADIENTYRLLRDARARLASTPEEEREAVRDRSRQSLLLQLGQERFHRLDRAGLLSLVE